MQTPEIKSLLEEAWSVRYDDPCKALELSEKSFGLSLEEDYQMGISCSEGMSGVAHFLLNNKEMVFEHLERAISFLERNPDHVWHTRFLIFYANASHNAGLLTRAISSVKKAVRLATTSDLTTLLADAYAMQGTIYRNVGLFEDSLFSFRNALEIRKKAGDKKSVASTLNQIAYTCSSMKDYNLSLGYYSQSEQIRSDEGFESDLGYTYLGKASVYELIENLTEADFYYQRGLDVALKFKDQRLECHCSLGLGKIRLKYGDLSRGKILFQRALEISAIIGSNELKQLILLPLSELLEKEGDHLNSLQSLKALLTLQSEPGILETISHIHRETINLLTDVDSSLRYARRIQNAILPSEGYLNEQLNSYFIIYQPYINGSLGGDFYFCQEENGIIFFAVADCTGHGVPGAMTSMLAYTSLRTAINDEAIEEPGKILDFCNKYFATILRTDETEGEVNDGMDITLISFRRATGTLLMASANNPLFQIRKNQLFEHKGNRGSISKTTHVEKFDTIEISYEKDDIFYFCTDGFKDQFGGAENKKFGSGKLRELLVSVNDLNFEEQRQVILNALNHWIGPEQQVDDILLIGLRI